MIAGLKLLEPFTWTIFVFGIILIVSGIRLWSGAEEKVEPEKNPIVREASRYLPITNYYDGSKFITNSNGRIMFASLTLVFLAVETTDVVFEFDSIPATIAITMNFFIAYTSKYNGYTWIKISLLSISNYICQVKIY